MRLAGQANDVARWRVRCDIMCVETQRMPRRRRRRRRRRSDKNTLALTSRCEAYIPKYFSRNAVLICAIYCRFDHTGQL